MAYRVESPGELCSRCDQPAPQRCQRCDSPYCERHSPPGDRRCDPCESDYLSHETRRIRTVVVAIMVVSGIVAFFGVVAIHAARNGFIRGPMAHMAPLILYGALLAMAIGFGLPSLMRRTLRRRFLAERPRGSGKSSTSASRARPPSAPQPP